MKILFFIIALVTTTVGMFFAMTTGHPIYGSLGAAITGSIWVILIMTRKYRYPQLDIVYFGIAIAGLIVLTIGTVASVNTFYFHRSPNLNSPTKSIVKKY